MLAQTTVSRKLLVLPAFFQKKIIRNSSSPCYYGLKADVASEELHSLLHDPFR